MAIERIFDIQGFDGGESDDIYKGPTNSFYTGKNIEVRKDLSGMQLASLTEDTGWVFDADICYMGNLATLGYNGGDIIVVRLENGKIYFDGALKTTLATGTNAWNRVAGVGINTIGNNQYIYYITQTSGGSGKVHRSTTNGTTWDVSYRSYTTGLFNTDIRHTISDNGILYFAYNNSIFTIDDTEILEKKLELPSLEGIYGFTQFQDTFKIYTRIGSLGVHYMWDGNDTLPYYRQEWINQPILGVVNDGANDYAILGYNEAYSDLYLISGTQKQELRVNLETSNTARRLNGNITIREGILYISGKLNSTDNALVTGVFTYGNYYPGTTKSLVAQYTSGDNTFLYHRHGTAQSWFANSDSKVFKVIHNNPPTKFAPSGYIITQMYQGISWEDKTLTKIKIGYRSNGGTIKIYARTSMGNSWKLLKHITDTNKKRAIISKTELVPLNIGNFNEIQFKIELLNPFENSNVILTRFTAFMEVTNQD